MGKNKNKSKIIPFLFINDKREYKILYNLLSKVNSDRLSKKEEDYLEVFLDRVAFRLIIKNEQIYGTKQLQH